MDRLSNNKKRNQTYQLFLQSCKKGDCTTNDIVQLGYRLMRKANLHPHFFQNNSLLATAQHLAFFALSEPINKKLSIEEAIKVINLFERRIAERIPVEYITHEAEYLDHKFYVNHHVLVPRSLMNNRFSDFLNETSWENYRVLDLCTGSGCIGISLALLNPNISVDLVDIDLKALDVANRNIHRHNLQARVNCIQSDLFENINNKYDLIISNPPYVSTAHYNATPLEFKNEPKIALECGRDGLTIIHKILAQAKNHLNSNGSIIMEVGYPAAKLLKKKYRHISFEWFTYKKPFQNKSKISQWIDNLLAMEGVFRCDAKSLS